MGRCNYRGRGHVGAYGGIVPMLDVGMGLRRKHETWCCKCRWMAGEFCRTGGGRGGERTGWG